MPNFGKPQPEQDATNALRSVTLVNGRHRWRFICSPHDRESLISAMDRRVGSDESDLSAEDAAIVAHQLRDHIPSRTARPGGRSTNLS